MDGWRTRGTILRFRSEGKLLDLSGARLEALFRHVPLLEKMLFGGGGFAAVPDDFCVEAPGVAPFTFEAFTTALALLEGFDESGTFRSSDELEDVEKTLTLLKALAAFDTPAYAWCAKRLRSLAIKTPRTPEEDLGHLFQWHVVPDAGGSAPAAGFELHTEADGALYYTRPRAIPAKEAEDWYGDFSWTSESGGALIRKFIRRMWRARRLKVVTWRRSSIVFSRVQVGQKKRDEPRETFVEVTIRRAIFEGVRERGGVGYVLCDASDPVRELRGERPWDEATDFYFRRRVMKELRGVRD